MSKAEINSAISLMPASLSGEPVLCLENLKTYFDTDHGVAKAVDGVSLSIHPGQTLGVVGESGCGKSVTALSILNLFPSPPGRYAGGHIWFKGKDIMSLSKRELRSIRGCEISMIFQEPMTSLNPVYTIGSQLVEAICLHQKLGKVKATEKAVEMLNRVRIASPADRIKEYPHQLSGGMRQRAMIAMALSCNPSLLIADEPTTALDVTIQAQIIGLMNQLKADLGTAIMFITHDLGVVAETAQQVAVMYAGRVVEHTDVYSLFENPMHPYTEGLIGSIPSDDDVYTKAPLKEIKGLVPLLTDLPQGCSFHPRCERAMDICTEKAPELGMVETGHEVSCWLYSSKGEAR